jgi:hypothetical protein
VYTSVEVPSIEVSEPYPALRYEIEEKKWFELCAEMIIGRRMRRASLLQGIMSEDCDNPSSTPEPHKGVQVVHILYFFRVCTLRCVYVNAVSKND